MARPFAVIDSETDPFIYGRVPAPFIWGFYDGQNYEEFKHTIDLVRFLSDKEIIVYAHNGGKFDYFFLTDFMEHAQEILIINGRIAKFKIGQCEFRDSYNILPIPLSAYQKDEVDYRIFEAGERDKPHNKKIISTYLFGDCKYLWEVVAAFIEKHGLAITQAGASMKLFQSMTENEIPRSNEKFFEHMRPFYYGGRVQCFSKGIGKEKFSVFDINSAYPFAMCHEHPFNPVFIRCKKPLEYCYEKPQAFFKISAVSRSALPWREKVGSKLIFPNDSQEREYFVSGWELASALRNRAITRAKVLEVFDFTETICFSDYILDLYRLRKEAKAAGNKADDILYKLAMNSLYGKFGADPSNYTRAVLFDVNSMPDLLKGEALYNGKKFCYDSQLGELIVGVRPLEWHERRYYNVATAASITGFVRAFLFDSLQKCERPLYCDTDSIACVDGSALNQGSELGQWKHEGDFSQWAIAGRKMYAFYPESSKSEIKTASKGARLTADEIYRIARGEVVEYRQDAPTFSVARGVTFTKRQIRMTE